VTKKIKILFRKMKIKLEYIWLDGGKPEPSLRSKTKVLDAIDENNGSFKIPGVKDLPIWNFDGSSTAQAKGNFSEVLLKPVRMYENPLETFSLQYFDQKTFCSCLWFANNVTPHFRTTEF
jgi:hypothetical protein